MKSLWIPLGSFALAVALSVFAGGRAPLSARQSGNPSGCECKLEILQQSGTLNWNTSSAVGDLITKLNVKNGASLCVASDKPGGADKWTAKWTATNIHITYTFELDNGVVLLESRVIPIEYADDSGKAPCKPQTAAAIGSANPNKFKKAAEAAVLSFVTAANPGNRKIKVLEAALFINPTFNWTLKADVGCGASAGPLALSIATFTPPKNAISGEGANSVTYKTSCP